MSIPQYMSGSLVRVSAAFTDITGAAADPTTITLKYRKDAGATTTIVYPAAGTNRSGTGAYYADLDTTGWAGTGFQTWEVEWVGTGTVQAISTYVFQVIPPGL